MVKHFLLITLLLFCRIGFTQSYAFNQAGASGLATANANLNQQNILSLFSNPAGLVGLQHWQVIAFSENRYFLKELNAVSIGIAGPLSSGSIGLSVQTFGFQLYREQTIGVAYSRRLLENFTIGAKFDWLQTRIAGYGSKGLLTFELGFQYAISTQVHLGMYLYNPAQVRLEKEQPLAAILQIGLTYLPVKYLTCSLLIEQNSQHAFVLKTGIEYLIGSQLFLRCGIQTLPTSWRFGIGYKMGRLLFNMGMAKDQVLGIQSSFGIRFEMSHRGQS